jgi:hypothetical protein
MRKTEAATAEAGGAVADKEPLTPEVAAQGEQLGRALGRVLLGSRRAPVRVRVTFEEPAEFLQELEERAAGVEGGVVRYIIRYDPPGEGYGARRVDLVAGAVVNGEILELAAKAGAVWGDGGEADQATKKRVDEWHGALVELCGKAGLVLKGGRFGAV